MTLYSRVYWVYLKLDTEHLPWIKLDQSDVSLAHDIKWNMQIVYKWNEFLSSAKTISFQVLLFNAYFKQTLNESDKEYYRVRPVKIYYYLEDDSISVVEPIVENSGIPQGKLIKRQRLPKNDQGWFYFRV